MRLVEELGKREEAVAVTFLAVLCAFTWRRCNTEPRAKWVLAAILGLMATYSVWVLIIIIEATRFKFRGTRVTFQLS